jgi:hypothetical protein
MEQRDPQTEQNNIYEVYLKHIPSNILTLKMDTEKQKQSPGIG